MEINKSNIQKKILREFTKKIICMSFSNSNLYSWTLKKRLGKDKNHTFNTGITGINENLFNEMVLKNEFFYKKYFSSHKSDY